MLKKRIARRYTNNHILLKTGLKPSRRNSLKAIIYKPKDFCHDRILRFGVIL